MMEYPRFPISEMHLGKIPDSMEFQSWKVNFMTDVCANSVFPQITMHWIKEVEIAKAIGPLADSIPNTETGNKGECLLVRSVAVVVARPGSRSSRPSQKCGGTSRMNMKHTRKREGLLCEGHCFVDKEFRPEWKPFLWFLAS